LPRVARFRFSEPSALEQLSRDARKIGFDVEDRSAVEHRREFHDPLGKQGLLQAWVAIGRDAEVRDVRAWLYRIVHNEALNVSRRQELATEQLDEEFDGVPQPPDVLARIFDSARIVPATVSFGFRGGMCYEKS